MMGWLWFVQLVVDAVLVVAVVKLMREKRAAKPDEEPRVQVDLQREDFEHYQQAMSGLCDRMNREAEQWLLQLEQKTRIARQTLTQVERGPSGETETRPVRPVPVAEPRTTASSSRSPETGLRDEVAYLFSQGYTIDQIARRLQIGQREVQLFLSVKPRR